ncbi:MAG TPA: NAD-dependent epimerase/dehydratase family protein [Jiangellaceae bacterium]|nr:NAD-dependent epimerase/dehydratase family protein [Jiangellaceae bacterium]
MSSTSASARANGRVSGRHVLVTGASGFIGQHVVAQMRAAGYQVTAADLVPFPDPDVPTVLGDLCEESIREAAVTPGIDAIVHLAAATSVLGSVERPGQVHRTNVEMTAGLLELARTHDVGAFILASTNAVVGDIGASTITEDLPLAPLTPYGGTKAAGEMLLHGYAGAYGIRAPLVRLTNVYGPGMAHKDSFVPRLMRAAVTDTGVQIYGDGEQRRDLVYVTDAARALVAALDWPTGPVIIGGSRSYTVNEITRVAREASARPIPAEHVAPMPGEMPAVVVDIARARSRGFEPEVSLSEGMRSVWADFAPSPVAQGSGDAQD